MPAAAVAPETAVGAAQVSKDVAQVSKDVAQVSKDSLAAGLAFPMWVVPIPTMIEIAKSGELLPKHEELRESGKCVQWKPGMNTIFFSHTCASEPTSCRLKPAGD